MKRARRYCPAGIPVHVVQRGNNRSECFKSPHDMATYINYLHDSSETYAVDIHAWVLMTNHVHLLVTPNTDESVSLMMQNIGRNYVRFFNRKHARTGTLWEGRFRSCLVQTERYFLICQRYIELNPVRAGMVENLGEYHWSSYHSNALGRQSKVLKPHEVYLALGKNKTSRLEAYRELFRLAIADEDLRDIRSATQRNLAFGSDKFKKAIEKMSSQRITLLKPGPSARATG